MVRRSPRNHQETTKNRSNQTKGPKSRQHPSSPVASVAPSRSANDAISNESKVVRRMQLKRTEADTQNIPQRTKNIGNHEIPAAEVPPLRSGKEAKLTTNKIEIRVNNDSAKVPPSRSGKNKAPGSGTNTPDNEDSRIQVN